MDHATRNLLVAQTNVLRQLLRGDVPHQADRDALERALVGVMALELAPTTEHPVTKHGQLLQQAEDEIVADRKQIDQLKADKVALQAQLDAAGKPTDPALILDTDDVKVEGDLTALLNPAPGSAAASVALTPPGA